VLGLPFTARYKRAQMVMKAITKTSIKNQNQKAESKIKKSSGEGIKDVFSGDFLFL
jgi:hypothetical protein